MAARPTVPEWLARTRRRPSGIDRADVLEALDELRGPWPTKGPSMGPSTAPDADADHTAPHVIDIEVLSVIRRHHLSGRLDETASRQAIEDLRDWPGERFGHQPLLTRVWELRAAVRGCDAAYVALAEAFEATLLTLDERLARASGPRCLVDVVA